MSSTVSDESSAHHGPVSRKAVWAWGMWDWGSAAFNAVIVTFVFSVYLTDAVGADLDSPLSAATWISVAMTIAGLVIALTAPVMGQRADRGGRRRRAVGVWTYLTVLAMLGMAFVRDDPSYLWLGLVLLAVGSIFFEFAEVSYFAMLRQVSRPETIGRISGFGWALGYVGGIVLLLTAYVGFIAGEGAERGLLGIPTEGGLNIRLVCVLAAVWFAVFAFPVLVAVPSAPPSGEPGSEGRTGIVESYRRLVADVRALWRRDRRTVWFLIASAVFRDGLAGIFTFGAILAVSVYGIAAADVLLFGVAANVVAALGAFLAGYADDAVGPKIVIIVSLVALLVTMGVLFFVDGPLLFWVFGLAMCAFVGPAQSASRSFLARVAPDGHDGQMFGLYATTGRAVSFLAPALFALFTGVAGNDRAGILGIALVVLVGLLLLLPVAAPERRSRADLPG